MNNEAIAFADEQDPESYTKEQAKALFAFAYATIRLRATEDHGSLSSNVFLSVYCEEYLNLRRELFPTIPFGGVKDGHPLHVGRFEHWLIEEVV